MLQKHADSAIQAEITAINREFLGLLIHPRLAEGTGVLGLASHTLASVRRLSVEDIDRLAQAPLLLAEFSPFPGVDDQRAVLEHKVADASVCQTWQLELNAFANRLLTFIWQSTRYEQSAGTFCLGLHQQQISRLASLGFTNFSRGADFAPCCLRARLGNHPSYWRDMVRAVRANDPEQQLASQLALIQLSVAGQCLQPQSTAQRYS